MPDNRFGELFSEWSFYFRNADCDIRVQLPNVAKEHCRIEVDADGNVSTTDFIGFAIYHFN